MPDDDATAPFEPGPEDEAPPPAQPTEPIARPEPPPLETPAAGPARPAPPPATPSVAGDEPDALPSLEDITFEPKPGPAGAPPAVTAARRPRERKAAQPGSSAPTALSRRRYATLEAYADALLPPGGTIPPSAAELGIAERLDVSLRGLDPVVREDVARALTTIELSSIPARFVRPFSKLGRAARTSEVERARASRLDGRRRAAETVAFLVQNHWAASPVIEAAVGFTYECVSSEGPREAPALEVLSFPQVSRDHVEECDVVVVGSGAGGAVVAKELAEIGHTVVVIEEGASFSRRDFGGPPLERFLKLHRRNGLTAAHGPPDVWMPLGMGVGGSTLTSAGTAVRAPDSVLMRWEKELGIAGIDAEAMRPFYERTERIQRVAPVPDEHVTANARALMRGAQAVGVHGGVVHRTVEGCRGCGVCAVGCPTDAKLGTNLTYLPRAQRHGTVIYGNARAHRILIEDGRARGIEASLLDPRTREPRATLTVRAKIVVLAAGAIHTPALLADNALGNRSGMLGANLHVQPAAMVGAFFADEVHGWRGVPEPYAVDGWLDSHHVVIEASAPIPSVTAGRFPGAGAALKDRLSKIGSYASARVTVTDTSTGSVARAGDGEPAIRYRLNQADARRLVRGIGNCAELFLAAGARAVHTGLPGLDPVTTVEQVRALKEDEVPARALRLESYAPSGTAAMGADPASSVVDGWGEIHGVPGLFVADASVLPTAIGVPPQMTVMAVATRAADHLARNASRYF